jgi:hypothetical protein
VAVALDKQFETAAREAGIGVTPFFDGARFDLPPRPARRGLGLGMIAMGVFITGFMCVWMGGPIKGAMTTPPPMRWFLLGFGLLGLPGLGAAVHMGRLRVMIAANAHTLGLRRISPFGTREVRMPRDEITAVRVGPSGMTVNDRPVLELQFHLRAPKKKVGCLSQLDDAELRWLAFELRRRLHVPARVS